MTAGKNANVSWFLNFRLSVRPGETTARRVRKFLIQEKTWKRVADSNLFLPCNIYRQLLFYSLGVNKTIFRDRKNARVTPKTQWKGKTWVSGLPNGVKGEDIQASQRQTSEKSRILSGGYSPTKATYVSPHGVGFWSFCPFWSGIGGVVFEGTAGVYERIYLFNFKWVRKKKKYANSNFFCLRSTVLNLGSDNIISA